MKSALLVFVDGLGVGLDDPSINPIHSGACPVLERLIRKQAVEIDASLGLPGHPQSATGTTAILTGINAARLAGRHVEGFPRGRLKEVIKRYGLFCQLAARGLRSTFANAYFIDNVSEMKQRRFQSVTTVATLSAFGRVPDKAMLYRNEAVYQDLTREGLRSRGYTGPLISPAEAAHHLGRITRRHHLTLFEYFQTDRAGHAGDPARVKNVLALLDAFLRALLRFAIKERLLLVITSDHGNIEDSRTHGHTANPVPFIVVGRGGATLKKRVKSIVDITPALLEWFSRSG